MARPAVFLLLLLLCVTGCGYRFTNGGGSASASLADSTAGAPVHLAIGSVEDRSREPLLGALVRKHLTARGLERADVTIVQRGSLEEQGHFRLDLVLGKLSEAGRANTKSSGAREYNLTARADAAVSYDGEKVWVAKGISARREFARSADIDSIRFNKDRALELLAEDLAAEALRRALIGIRGVER